jgi:hypothetical protein
MKKIVSILILMMSLSTLAADYTLDDISGNYTIVIDDMPVSYMLDIDEDSVILVETGYQTLNCVGFATITNNIVTSEVICDNDAQFIQTIDLKGVKNIQNLSTFRANVFSSLYGTTKKATFYRN